MKSNNNQKVVITTIASHIESWATTNDINSPSHYNLNHEWYVGLNLRAQDELEDSSLDIAIRDHIDDLLFLIRKIK